MNYTPKQLQIMTFIRDYRRTKGTAPTLEEIGQSLGIHRVTVHQHVGALVKKGAVQKLPQRSRSIEILDRDFLPKPTIALLGRIAAGRPIEAVEEAEQFTIEDLLPVDLQSSSFLLRVVGSSMIEDHIADGDFVLVERRSTADNGDTVVAILPGEAREGAVDDAVNDAQDIAPGGAVEETTLKRYYREAGGVVRLEPRNSRLKPIRVRRVEIRGVVRGVLRKY